MTLKETKWMKLVDHIFNIGHELRAIEDFVSQGDQEVDKEAVRAKIAAVKAAVHALKGDLSIR